MIKLLFAGDFIPHDTSAKIYSNALLEVLKEKDFSIVNLEAPLTNSSNAILKTGNNYRCPPGAINHIKAGFFDAVSISNNHIRDFGNIGVCDTISTCKNNNIQHVGAGTNIEEASEPLRIEIKGKKISILNFSEKEFNVATEKQAGANPFDLINACRQIKREKEISDLIIIIYHGGTEYHYLPSPEIVRTFKFLIEVGADIIISHHTHRYSGIIYSEGKPIIFGLGNFLASTISRLNDDWLIGMLAKLMITETGISVEPIPIQMNSDFNKVNLLPDIKKQQFFTNMSELSSIIRSDNLLQEYWSKEYNKSAKNIIAILKSTSKLEYRLRKNFPFLFRPKMVKYQLTNLLNMIRCSSHQERLVSVLEDLYDDIKKN